MNRSKTLNSKIVLEFDVNLHEAKQLRKGHKTVCKEIAIKVSLIVFPCTLNSKQRWHLKSQWR